MKLFESRSESQNVEFKKIWRDEYLQWVCGFANAQGGTLYIGIDDMGNLVGVEKAKKLAEDIPNKIVSLMGIRDSRGRPQGSNFQQRCPQGLFRGGYSDEGVCRQDSSVE